MRALGKGSLASFVKVALDIARWVLWFAAICFTIITFCYLGLLALVATGVTDSSILSEIEGNVDVGGGMSGFAYDGPARWPVLVPALLAGVANIVGAIIIVGRLRRLFAGFSSGEPFRREYADHLRVIWITMLSVELVRYVLLALIGVLLVAFGSPEGRHASLDIHIDWSTWLSIFVLIVLAEVFREGARLKEEQELTI